MDALENEIDSAKYEVIRQYADMVVSTFKTLAQKYVPVSYEDFWPENFDSLDNSSQDDSAQDEADSAQGQLKAKKDALDQLESNLMLLKHLITTMCLSLDPLRLVEDPALHLQLVLDIQPQFEHTYDQIKRATDIIFLRQANYSRRSDQHLQILKSFRLRHLQYSLRECLEESTFDFLHVWGDSIVAVGFSHVHFLSRHSARPRPWTPCPTVLEWIDYTVIKCLKQSEFNLVQQHWSYQISLINHHLEYFVRSIHLITPTRQNQPVIQIAKSLPTIIKLCRLLVGKISKCCTKRLPFFTGMRSDQLKCLEDFPDKVGRCLAHFGWHLTFESAADRPGSNLAGTAQSLEAGCNSALLIISLQVLPLISDSDSIPGQDSFKSWFITWCSQFSLAMENLNDKIKFYIALNDHDTY